MYAALLLCLIGMAVAQQPVPCTTPAQWEGRIFDSNEKQNLEIQGRFSYDAVYRRERIIEEVEDGTVIDNYDTVALFDLKVEFIYNFRARNCTRREITRPWRDFGIRANDTSYGEAYIGTSALPGAGILVTIWGGNFTTPDNDTISYVSTWTYQGCVPLSRTSFSPRLGVFQLSFYDVSLGIRDPNVFIPRRECLTDERMGKPLHSLRYPIKQDQLECSFFI